MNYLIFFMNNILLLNISKSVNIKNIIILFKLGISHLIIKLYSFEKFINKSIIKNLFFRKNKNNYLGIKIITKQKI